MDNDIQRIKQLIKSKKEKYPNLSNVWLKYLDKKIKLLEESLEKAESVFKNIETHPNGDLSYQTMAALYVLNQQGLH